MRGAELQRRATLVGYRVTTDFKNNAATFGLRKQF